MSETAHVASTNATVVVGCMAGMGSSRQSHQKMGMLIWELQSFEG
jgi:hypothetical protein